MNVTLKKADGYTNKPGHWWKQEHGGKVGVFVTCQHEHSYPAMIQGHLEPEKNWQIDAQGNVTPSIWIKGDCDWHVFATLEGWAERGAALPEWLALIAFGVLIGLMFAQAMLEPVLPDAEDCAARGQDEDCWKFEPGEARRGKEVYDLGGKRR